ncbi:PREDICTED: transcription factor bHLH92-like isoform X2 [Brassica oleracea var. oleracea]|uniref:transcription factor bHLH92-like isoform X2 n=1 Tax=Brassica oleracea var. oleracea TaxID=109376 RepID=UPI0006A716F8|nr:PREDICTED: transcription factor bHLH92-like isoform X2 [Brassica oleracea var. oleracea]
MDFFSLDSVFQEEGENFWDMIAGDVSGDGDGDKTVGVPNRSAFRSYVRDHEQRMVSSSSTVNVKRRMVNLLRKNWEEKKIVAVPEKERSRRHMMKERTRREKQKQSYLALQSLLPATKSDKNSIVEKAVDQIRKLEGLKKELERQKNVLEAKSAREHDGMNGTKVRFNVQEPLSGIDSVVEVLQCLKSMGTNLNAVQANFSPHEFSATMNIETQIRGEEVEKRVQKRLQETEWKLLFLPEASFLRD